MHLILGGHGFIGSAFSRRLKTQGADHTCVSRQHCDYYQCENLINLIRETGADFLINAAGYTGRPNVDGCESNKGECLLGNAVLPSVVRKACEIAETPWVHVSSGCIFNGSRPDGNGFTESDTPNFCFRSPPCSFYSGTKALGEECLEGCENVYIMRLRIPFDCFDSERNYLSKLMRYNRLLDVRNSITHLPEYVEACLLALSRRIAFGTYNVTNGGSITTREVTELIKQKLNVTREFDFFRDEQEFLHTAVQAPRSSCVLDNTKLLDTGITMQSAQVAINEALGAWSTRRMETVDRQKIDQQ